MGLLAFAVAAATLAPAVCAPTASALEVHEFSASVDRAVVSDENPLWLTVHGRAKCATTAYKNGLSLEVSGYLKVKSGAALRRKTVKCAGKQAAWEIDIPLGKSESDKGGKWTRGATANLNLTVRGADRTGTEFTIEKSMAMKIQ
ncbi:hypothetical protein [Kitasatospora sp. NPDC004289]